MAITKGIILAGGTGSRLHPLTLACSKQLMPIYDKPMIYYPLACLMLAGIRQIQIICQPHYQTAFEHLLQDGSQWGLQISYQLQLHPAGVAEAFLLSEAFIDNDPVCLILGDNLFYGEGLPKTLRNACQLASPAEIFAYYVKDPARYDVVTFNQDKEVMSIDEKPQHPSSNYAITGLYCFDHRVVKFAKQVKPSIRGELEIVDVLKQYLNRGELGVNLLGRGTTWLDAGTHSSLLEASNFVETVEARQGLKIACIEEVAYRMGFIDAAQVRTLANNLGKNDYSQYLLYLLDHQQHNFFPG